jgi:phosphotriesterase-related protein
VFAHHLDYVLSDIDLACQELAMFRDAGGSSLVEVTTPDLGRRPDFLVEVSRRTGVHVVMSTGRYVEPFYEEALWRRTTNDIADEFVRDIEDGVDGVRAAVIGEIGVNGTFITPAEERVHRAAARAHVRTGAPITTHAALSPVGLDQLALFDEEGVDLRRVAIGHCDTYGDVDHLEAILARGAFVEFDLIQGASEWDTTRQVRLVAELVGRGHMEQTLLSQDICTRSSLVAYGGNGYAYLVRSFVPRLREAGLSDEQVAILLVSNPRRLLTGEGPIDPR